MRRAYLAVPLLALTSACGDAAVPPDECADELAVGSWVGFAPPRFVELWRAGGMNEGEELALPMSVNVGPQGQLAVVDFQLGLVGIAPDGRWLGSLTRPGEGPGEIGMPLAATYDDDGALSILDFGNGKVAVLDREGRLLREFRVDPTPLSAAFMSGSLTGLGMAADGSTYVHLEDPRVAEGMIAQSILRSPADGSPPDTVASTRVPSLGSVWARGDQIRAPGFPFLTFSVSPDGRFAYAGDHESYRVDVIGRDGSRSFVCRVVASAPIRPDEIELDSDSDRYPEYTRALVEAPRPSRPAPISRVLMGRGGRLWVERERFGASDGMGIYIGRAGSLFDVFDADGSYLGEVRAPDGIHVTASFGDRVWAIEYDDFDVPTVVAYRLETGME